MIHEYRLFEKIGCKVIFSFSFRAKETLEYFREKRVFLIRADSICFRATDSIKINRPGY